MTSQTNIQVSCFLQMSMQFSSLNASSSGCLNNCYVINNFATTSQSTFGNVFYELIIFILLIRLLSLIIISFLNCFIHVKLFPLLKSLDLSIKDKNISFPLDMNFKVWNDCPIIHHFCLFTAIIYTTSTNWISKKNKSMLCHVCVYSMIYVCLLIV